MVGDQSLWSRISCGSGCEEWEREVVRGVLVLNDFKTSEVTPPTGTSPNSFLFPIWLCALGPF